MPEGKGREAIFPLTINGPPNLPTKTRIQRRSAPPRLASPNRRCLDELKHARCTPRPRGQGKEPVDRYGRPSRPRNPNPECSPSLRSAPHSVTGEPDVLTHLVGVPPSQPPQPRSVYSPLRGLFGSSHEPLYHRRRIPFRFRFTQCPALSATRGRILHCSPDLELGTRDQYKTRDQTHNKRDRS